MLKRIHEVLDNECGTYSPPIIQLPLFILLTNILAYIVMFGGDFYQKPAEMLLH